MADEITISSIINIIKSGFSFRNSLTSYRADMTGKKGPTPGAVTVATAGTNISFSELTTPGFVYIENLDSTNYVDYGAWTGSVFYPIGELLPGEFHIIRLSRNVGTTLRMRANTAAVNVNVSAFEK